MNPFHGVYTALATPFLDNGPIDENSFRKLVRFQIESGVSGVVPCGTTGESPTLSTDEKHRLISIAVEECKGSKTQVMAGTGSNDTEETVALSCWAADHGADSLLIVTPYYNKPSQRGLEEHFRAVASAVKIPIVVYNVPSRTGVSIAVDTLIRLLEIPNISAIKEASGNVEFSCELISRAKEAGRALSVLTGDDTTFLPHLAAGGDGVISVASNVVPKEMVKLQNMFERGDVKQAVTEFQRLFPLCRDLFVETNPVPVKYLLSKMGFGSSRVRLPLASLSETSENRLVSTWNRVGQRS